MRCARQWSNVEKSEEFSKKLGHKDCKAADGWLSHWKSVVLTTHLLVPGQKSVGAVPPPAVCVSIGMSWGDLYFYIFQDNRVSVMLQ
jgi:hypothetical protein